ncbi:MAG: hypothetical protein ACHQD8_02625 [Chitinophagales bacterium]
MTVVEIKNKLHQQIDHGDEKLLKMIYALIKEYKEEEEDDIDEARKNLVMEERERYLAGIGKSYSWEEVKDMANRT